MHPSYPLNNRKDALRVIDELRANLTSLLKDISKEFYFLNEVFDTAYLQAFNILLYENNCNDNCSLNEGEDKVSY